MPNLWDVSFLKWFYPGMRIKRWLALLLLGVTIMGLGFGYFLREVYLTYTFPSAVYYITLQFLPRFVRGALLTGVSLGLILVAVWRLNQSLLRALMPGRQESMVEIIYGQRLLRRGPKVVAIGGGTGLSTLLRGLKEYTSNITAIVTVADDGGSSGRLRQELGILPPGDVRNCIAALADAEPLVTRLFQYRFSQGSGLEGHSFGNLFIVAMTGVTGNFEEAIEETSRVLLVRGRILPSTLSNVTLVAEIGEETVYGESLITEQGGSPKRVYLEPPNAQAHPEALAAIMAADLIVVGPGSLYTSVLPNLLVEGIRQAVVRAPALKVYVCNVACQTGETEGFTVADHVRVLEEHVGRPLFHSVLANANFRGWRQERSYRPVPLSPLQGPRLVTGDLVDEERPYHHEPKKLAQALLRLYTQRDRHRLSPAAPSAGELALTSPTEGAGS